MSTRALLERGRSRADESAARPGSPGHTDRLRTRPGFCADPGPTAPLARDEGLTKALGSTGTLRLAGFALLALVAGSGVWLASAPVESVTILPGSLALPLPVQVVEAQEAGRIIELHVQEGEQVAPGQPLLSLETTSHDTEIGLLVLQRKEVVARQSRLRAELDDRPIRGDATSASPSEARQDALLVARKALRRAEDARATAIIAGARDQLAAIEAQRSALLAQRLVVAQELEGLETLAARGLGDNGRLLGLRREGARLEGLAADLAGRQAELESLITQTRASQERAAAEWGAEMASENADLGYRLADIDARIAALQAARARLTLVAPSAGQVFGLSVAGPGATVRPGVALMRLLPEEPDLIVRARLPPDIADRVDNGQSARLRFVSIEGNSTPELGARVFRLVPEIGEGTGIGFVADLAPEPGALAALLPKAALRPGLPVEVHVAGPRRSTLAWLVRPLADFMGRALREP